MKEQQGHFQAPLTNTESITSSSETVTMNIHIKTTVLLCHALRCYFNIDKRCKNGCMTNQKTQDDTGITLQNV